MPRAKYNDLEIDTHMPVHWPLFGNCLGKLASQRILIKQEMTGWQWHQLEHRQISCTLLQTDNNPSTLSLNNCYRQDDLPDVQPTVSKHWRHCSCNTLVLHLSNRVGLGGIYNDMIVASESCYNESSAPVVRRPVMDEEKMRLSYYMLCVCFSALTLIVGCPSHKNKLN